MRRAAATDIALDTCVTVAIGTDIAREACSTAGVTVENEWERELIEQMRPSNDLWRSIRREAETDDGPIGVPTLYGRQGRRQ